MFCSNCGKQINEDVKFCTGCGAKNVAYAEKVQAIVQEPAPEPEQTVQEVTLTEEILPQESQPDEISTVDEPETEIVAEESSEIESADDNEIVPELIQPVEPYISQEEETSIVEEPVIEAEVIDQQQEAVESQPAIPAPVMPEAELPETPVEQTAPLKKKKGFGSYLGLTACFIMILVFVFSFMSVLMTRQSLSGKQIAKDINKIDVLDIKVGSMVTVSNVKIDDKDTVEDVVYKIVKENSSLKIDQSDIKEIINEAGIKEMLSEKLGSYVDYVATGAEIDELTAKDVVKVVEDNKDKIEEIADVKITNSNINALEDYLENDAHDLFESLSEDKISEALEETSYSSFESLLKGWVWVVILSALAVLAILFAFFAFKINKNASGWFVYIGSILVTCGSIYLVGGITLIFLKDTITEAVGEASEILGSIMPLLIARIIWFGFIAFIIGLITILIKKLVCRIKAKKVPATV